MSTNLILNAHVMVRQLIAGSSPVQRYLLTPTVLDMEKFQLSAWYVWEDDMPLKAFDTEAEAFQYMMLGESLVLWVQTFPQKQLWVESLVGQHVVVECQVSKSRLRGTLAPEVPAWNIVEIGLPRFRARA